MNESIVFLGSFVAYAGLGVSTVLTCRGRFDRRLAAALAVIVVVHVIGIWSHRYGWSFEEAVRNGYAGFVAFHGALLAIVVAAFVRERLGAMLHRIAFGVVSVGSIGVAFLREEVAVYRVPLLVILVTTLIFSFLFTRRSRHQNG